jgi:Tol biopolymer transport system component
MDSHEPIFLPEQYNNNRKLWTCVAVIGLTGCGLVLVLGILAWALIPKDVLACIDWLSPRSSAAGNGQIAFVSDRDGNPEIYVIHTDGTSATRLTDNPAGDYDPAWSPDGTRIAFYSERDGNAEIYVMNANGSNLTRLTNNPANDYAPAWSPDGKQIAFHSHRYLGAGRIFVMNIGGSGVRRLTDPAWDDWSPAWSPDGTQIVFNSSRFNKRDIWLMNADGSGMKNLTRNPADDWWPDWSPDGTHIVFHSARDGNFEIYSIKTDGSEVTRLTDHPASDYDPVWSPDGKQIAFTSDRCGNRDIWLMNADGAEVAKLTRHPAHDWAPAWRPEGTKPVVKLIDESKNDGVQKEEPTPEIEIANPGTNLARGKQILVSRALASNPARMAVDGNLDNWWGAGAFAPQWIELDLEANYVIASIRLLPSQSPAGETVHRLLVKGPATGNSYQVLHTFRGTTADFRWLTFELPEPLRGIRYIRVETVSSPSWISWREIQAFAGE